jgi:hypothetical protein
MANLKRNEPLPSGALAIAGTAVLSRYALGGVLDGLVVRSALTFFNPAVASGVGSFGSFAAMGAIAAPMRFIHMLAAEIAINKSSFLSSHPRLRKILLETNSLFFYLHAVTFAAMALEMPSTAITIMSMIVLPALMFAIRRAVDIIGYLRNPDQANIAAPAYTH